MFIRKYEKVIETKTQASNIWELWQDPSSWHTWDSTLKTAFIEGNFNVGSRQKINIKLVNVDINKALLLYV